MNFNLKRPCASCPFRTDIAFPLADERRASIAESLQHGDQTFACHNTVNYDDGHWNYDTGEYTNSGDESHCAGALIVMAKSGQLWANVMIRMAKAFGWFDETELHLHVKTFGSLEEFCDGGGQAPIR